MEHSSGTVLSTEHVDLVRDGRYLLQDINISIEPGQHWVLLGANGAGKSTLLSLFGATAHPTRGSVFVLGHKLGRVDMRELRMDIGHVNPRHTIGIPITVRNVVITGLTNTTELMPRWSPTPEQEAHADALIDLLGMSQRSNALWPNLSQGERGRALIARALMVEPRLLLLDEPATGLDLAAREQLLSALDDLRSQNPSLASILVTHHIEEIPSTTTHALLIKDGIVTATGLADDVITSENISDCFSHPIEIERRNGRWNARSHPRQRNQLSQLI